MCLSTIGAVLHKLTEKSGDFGGQKNDKSLPEEKLKKLYICDFSGVPPLHKLCDVEPTGRKFSQRIHGILITE
jgi:hypothetical protein